MPVLDVFHSIPGRGMVPVGLDGRVVTDVEGIGSIAEAFARRRGFRHFLVCFRIFPRPELRIENALSNYPPEWLRRYQNAGYVTVDPVLRTWREGVAPFTWSALLREYPHAREYFLDAANHGLKDALVVPWHGARGAMGMFCLVSDQGKLSAVDVEECGPDAVVFAVYLFKSLVDIVMRDVPDATGPALTQAQRDVLFLIAQGKTLKEAAVRLGIDWRSAKERLERCQTSLGVGTREEAIVRAIECGELYRQPDLSGYDAGHSENLVTFRKDPMAGLRS